MKKCCLQVQKLQIHWCSGSILPVGNRFLSSFVFILWHQLRGVFIFSYFVASYSVSSIMHVFRWICPLITCLVKWTASRRPFVSLHNLSCYSISEVDLCSHCYLVFHHAYVPMDISFFVVALYASCMYSYSQAEAAEVRREFPLHPTWICCPPPPGLWLLLVWKKCKQRSGVLKCL